jgi:hypothetical protein
MKVENGEGRLLAAAMRGRLVSFESIPRITRNTGITGAWVSRRPITPTHRRRRGRTPRVSAARHPGQTDP